VRSLAHRRGSTRGRGRRAGPDRPLGPGRRVGRGDGPRLRHAGLRHVRPGDPGAGGRPPRRPRQRRTRARAGHRDRSRRDPARRGGRAGAGHRTLAGDARSAPGEGRRAAAPGGARRHGDRARPERLHPRVPRLQLDLVPAHPGRAGRLRPQRRPAPRAGRALRGRAVRARPPVAATGQDRRGVRRRAGLPRDRHLGRGDAAPRLPPRPVRPGRRRRAGRARVPQPAPLRLAVRARPHGPTRGPGPRVAPRRLDRRAVHRDLHLPRLGVPAAYG